MKGGTMSEKLDTRYPHTYAADYIRILAGCT